MSYMLELYSFQLEEKEVRDTTPASSKYNLQVVFFNYYYWLIFLNHWVLTYSYLYYFLKMINSVFKDFFVQNNLMYVVY